MGKCCEHDSAFNFYWIFIKPADNRDRHKISDEFDFWPDPTSHFGVTFPWTPEKNVNTIAPFLLIGSSSNLQVTRTGLKSRTSLISSQIGLFTSELLTLERRRFPHIFQCGLDGTFFNVAGNEDRYNILDEFYFGPDRTNGFWVTCPWDTIFSRRLIMDKMLWAR